MFLLNVLKDLNILKYLDGRKTRNGELFRRAANKLHDAGFSRTPEQIRVRWKTLKKGYYLAKRANGKSGHNPQTCLFYDHLDELLGIRPLSMVEEQGVDVGFAASTQDAGK